MSLYNDILSRKEKVSVIGLGYVGMPLAAAFAKKTEVIGYDIDAEKIKAYRSGSDPTGEIGGEAVKTSSVYFTNDPSDIGQAKFHIVAVPTPINQDKTPDLSPVTGACRTVGRQLAKGSVVVFESTVYPGVTEDICIPILEEESGMLCGRDFKVGYSPERINPGDKVHRLENIRKIVSGIDEEALEEIKNIYGIIIEAGVFPVSSVRTAEAIKIAENSQRDINIAFMNELAMVFDRMGIDTLEVISGMNTKWNALGFYPGLVGGHCIGVDPYYFTYQAERLGYHSQIILSGRKVNDGMGEFVADAAIKQMIIAGLAPKTARVAVLGASFKENCPDIRNSRVLDIVKHLRSVGINPIISDPIADKRDVKAMYGSDAVDISDIRDINCLIIAIAHNEYRNMKFSELERLFADGNCGEKVVIDVKSIFSKEDAKGYRYWRL